MVLLASSVDVVGRGVRPETTLAAAPAASPRLTTAIETKTSGLATIRYTIPRATPIRMRSDTSRNGRDTWTRQPPEVPPELVDRNNGRNAALPSTAMRIIATSETRTHAD